MKLTTRGRYAVTAMLDLALHRERGPIALADISARQGISLSYLEQLFAHLRRADLVASSRGPGGGYQLGRGTREISVAEVIDAVDESVDATRCGGQQNCQAEHRCLTHNLWQDLSGQIRGFLNQISLDELTHRPSVIDVSARQDLSLTGARKNISVPVITDA